MIYVLILFIVTKYIILHALTLSPTNKLAAKFLVYFNFQSTLLSLRIGESVVTVSNCLDPGEPPNYSASETDPSCLHIAP